MPPTFIMKTLMTRPRYVADEVIIKHGKLI